VNRYISWYVKPFQQFVLLLLANIFFAQLFRRRNVDPNFMDELVKPAEYTSSV